MSTDAGATSGDDKGFSERILEDSQKGPDGSPDRRSPQGKGMAARTSLYFRKTLVKCEPRLVDEECRRDLSPQVRTRVTYDATKADDDQLLVWSKLPRPDIDTRRLRPVRTVHVKRKVTE